MPHFLAPFKIIAIVTLGLCLVSAGCALVKLNREVDEILESTILVGRVSSATPGCGPIIVGAYGMKRGQPILAHHTVLHEAGEFELMVSQGVTIMCLPIGTKTRT